MELIHKQSASCKYKITIPQKVESKIRILCNEINNIEWSGVLFYKVKGCFELNYNLEIVCEDVLLMDIGTSATTEFNMSPDVAEYVCDHPELMNCYTGLIHSHHLMATFFSGTDINTLLSEGQDTNHFVSLIVNNRGEYSAAITRKVKVKQTVIVNGSYNTWGNENIPFTDSYEEEKEYIEYYDLSINIEGKDINKCNELYDRIKTIKSNNKENTTPFIGINKNSYAFNNYGYGYKDSIKDNNKNNKPNYTQNQLFQYDTTAYNIDKDVVEWIIKQTITCSAIITSKSNIDLDKWVHSMDSMYSRRFDSIEDFEVFAEYFAEFLLGYTYIEGLDDTVMPTKQSVLAEAVINRLEEFKVNNKWLNKWIDVYSSYIEGINYE